MSKFGGLKAKLKKRGARHPGALAAYIGREKYGKKGMKKKAIAGMRKAKIRRGGKR